MYLKGIVYRDINLKLVIDGTERNQLVFKSLGALFSFVLNVTYALLFHLPHSYETDNYTNDVISNNNTFDRIYLITFSNIKGKYESTFRNNPFVEN